MKISISLNLNPVEVVRKCGYGLIKNNGNEQSFVRRLRSGLYPRFHIYIKNHFINLHLDQKQPSYKGSSAHSGEYNGEVVVQEAERIRNIIKILNSARS